MISHPDLGSFRDSELLGGVVEGDDALWIKDALGVPADEPDPEAMLGGTELRTRGGGRKVSADLHAGGEDRKAMVRELPMSGRPKARTVGGTLLASAIPSVERIDKPPEDGQGVRTEAIVPEGDLAALPSDMEAQHLEVAPIQGRVDDAGAQQEAVAATEAEARLLEHEILDHVSLEAAQAETSLAFLHDRMEFRPVLLRDQDGIAAHAGRPDVEPVDGADRRDAQRREQLEEVRTQTGDPARQDQDDRTDADAKRLG